MTTIGIALSSEEQHPAALVRAAQQAADAGFSSIMVSDHFHPWIDRQGQSGFVWSMIGAIAATTDLKVTTGVTCPTFRIHPVILAQAAATAQILCRGKFVFGVGSGEALNEQILGDRWVPADIRLEMLEEAVEVIRELWRGGTVYHRGTHYTVERARIYSLPDEPPPIPISGFGEKSLALAARIGDGFITTSPSGDAVKSYREQGGRGPVIAQVKVCWGEDEAKARQLAYELWPTTSVPGELSQELPAPSFFEQATQNVTEEMVASKIVCGPDPERHLEILGKYLDAGIDELYVTQIGEDQAGYFEFFNRELKPRLSL